MINEALEKIKEIENFLKQKEENSEKVLYHSGDASLKDDLKELIEPQFGNWLSEIIMGVGEDDLIKQIKEDKRNENSFFCETPSWVAIKAMRASQENSLSTMDIHKIMEYGQLCIVSSNEEDDFFKRAGYGDEGYVEHSTYLFSQEIADKPLPFGVETGDIYTNEIIEPDYTLTGVELVGFLARNYPNENIIKGNMKDIFEIYPDLDPDNSQLKKFLDKKECIDNNGSAQSFKNTVKKTRP